MKKIILALLLTLTMPLMATQSDCERNPHECYEPIPGPVGPQGEQGIPGEDGKDGVDGQDGVDGNDGATGEAGSDGQDGTNGEDGSNGQNGKNGTDGSDGVDGKDGKDADTAQIAQLQSDRKKLNSFANDAAAGNSAMASIDFGSIAKGETHGGLGIGVSKSWYGSSTAGAIGVKHGFTDETAGVLKVWSAGSNSYGGGAGVVHKF